MNVIFEIVGYAGTALILLSMMMTSVTKLRWLNLLGSLLSVIYALWSNTMPVFMLNISLVVINAIQLYRLAHPKKEEIE